MGGRPGGFRDPAHQRGCGFELGADDLVAARLVKPGLERMSAGDGEFLQPQSVEAGVVGSIAARSALELRCGQ